MGAVGTSLSRKSSVSPQFKPNRGKKAEEGRGVMEVGEAAAAAAAAGVGALGSHIDSCHFCLSLATPPLRPALSLSHSLSFFFLHFTSHYPHESASACTHA